LAATLGGPPKTASSGGCFDHVRDGLGMPVGRAGVLCLDHHSQHRLGAGSPDQDSTLRAKRFASRADRTLDRGAALPVRIRPHAHIDQLLGKQRHAFKEFGQGLAAALKRCKHQQRRDNAIAR